MASNAASKAVAAACVVPAGAAAFFSIKWKRRQPRTYTRLSGYGDDTDKEFDEDEDVELQPPSSAIVCRIITPIGALAAFFAAVWLVLHSFQKPDEVPRMECLFLACGWVSQPTTTSRLFTKHDNIS